MTSDAGGRRADFVVGADVEARRPAGTVRCRVAGRRTRHKVGEDLVGLATGRSLGQEDRTKKARHDSQSRKERTHGGGGSDNDEEDVGKNVKVTSVRINERQQGRSGWALKKKKEQEERRVVEDWRRAERDDPKGKTMWKKKEWTSSYYILGTSLAEDDQRT